MLELYIVRHGETLENAKGILQGHLQGQLSPKGIQQAQEMRDSFAELIHPDKIITSDLTRTVDTANLLNEAFHVPLDKSALLRERDWGEYTGMEIKKIPKGDFPPSVESIAQMMTRAETFLQQLSEDCLLHPQIKSVLIVSHGVFSRCLLAAATCKGIHEIPLLKNLEMRQVSLSLPYLPKHGAELSSKQEGDNASILSQGKEA